MIRDCKIWILKSGRIGIKKCLRFWFWLSYFHKTSVNCTMFRIFCGREEIRMSVTSRWLTEKRSGKAWSWIQLLVLEEIEVSKPAHSLLKIAQTHSHIICTNNYVKYCLERGVPSMSVSNNIVMERGNPKVLCVCVMEVRRRCWQFWQDCQQSITREYVNGSC